MCNVLCGHNYVILSMGSDHKNNALEGMDLFDSFDPFVFCHHYDSGLLGLRPKNDLRLKTITVLMSWLKEGLLRND